MLEYDAESFKNTVLICTALCCFVPPWQPSLVKHIELSADWCSKAAGQQVLHYVASTFTQLKVLEISAE
jgi:hypothetical protein